MKDEGVMNKYQVVKNWIKNFLGLCGNMLNAMTGKSSGMRNEVTQSRAKNRIARNRQNKGNSLVFRRRFS